MFRYLLLAVIYLSLANAHSKRDGEVIYTPKDWKMPEMADGPMQYTTRPQTGKKSTVAYGGRSGGTWHISGQRGVDETCWTLDDVLGMPAKAVGSCLKLPDEVKYNPRSGFRPSPDVNCIMFLDEECRYTTRSAPYNTMPSVVLQPPGIDELSMGWWQKSSGLFLKYYNNDNKKQVVGPAALQCFPIGNGNIGLGKGVETYAGLGKGY